MKPRILATARLSLPLAAALAALAALLSAPALRAADTDGTWLGTSGDWGSVGTWNGGIIADGIGFTANFTGVDITADQIIALDTARTIGNITFTDDTTSSNNLTISGANTLTLNVASGASIIDVTQADRTLIISSDIAGDDGLTKNGSGTLRLEGNNILHTGATTVNLGVLAITNNNALGTAAGTTTVNGGSLSTGVNLSLSPATSGLTLGENINLAANTSGRANLVNDSIQSHTLNGNIDVTSDTNAAQIYSTNNAGSITINGNITGTFINGASFLIRGGSTNTNNRILGDLLITGGNFSKTDLGTWLVGSPLKNYSWGDTRVAVGTLMLGKANIVSGTGQLVLGNSTGTSAPKLDLNGFSQVYSGLIYNGAATEGLRTVTNDDLTAAVLTINNSANFSPVGLSGLAANSIVLTGNLGLVKDSAGTLTLSGANTYTGATTITAGTLSLANATPLGTTPGTNGTSGISMAAGAVLQSATAGANPSTTIAAPITLGSGGNITLRIGQGAASNTHTFNLNGAIGGATDNLVFTTTTSSFNNGSSVFVLGAAGGYAGNTRITTGNGGNNPVTVKAGTGVVNALPDTTVLTFDNVAGGGTGRNFEYDMNGNDQTLAGLTNGGIAPQLRRQLFRNTGALATLTINNTNDFTFGGAYLNTANSATTRAQITGNIALTKSGAGTFTLGGALVNGATENGHPFTGQTKVLGGTLVLGETLSLQNSAFDTASSITGDGSNGLKTTVTALTLGGLTGNQNFADVFTTSFGGYDGLTALTLNPGAGVTNTYSADIGNGAGNLSLTKTGTGTQILSGANTYTGGTTLTNGTLQFNNLVSMPATGAVAVGTGSSLAINVGGPGEWTAGTSGIGTLGGLLGGLGGQTGGTVTYTGDLSLGLDTTNASPTTQTFAGSVSNVGTSLAITKLGGNTLALSGLSATAASNYSGLTIINEGTLAFTTTNPSLTGGLTFGATSAITTLGILDLTTANASFGGVLSVNSNSATASEIKIGAAQTLTIGSSGVGDHRIGAVTPTVTATVTKLNMTGGGTLNVAGATFAVAASSSSTLNQAATLDLTALKATTINLTGNFRISPNTTANIGGQGTMLLPTPVVADTLATTTITTTGGNITVGGGGSLAAGGWMNTLQLGTGLTTLNAANINIASGGRDLGQIIYGQAEGDLIIRAGDGTSRATAINVGAIGGATGSVGATIRVDLAGHDADILVTSLNLGNQARTSTQTYEFNFGAGDNSLASKLDATNVNIGFYPSASSNNSTRTSKVNLSGGTVIFGDGTGTGVDIGSSLYVNAGTAPLIGELNISNGNVTINNGVSGFAVRLGSNQATGGGTVTASMNLTGGTTTLGGDIVRGLVSPRTTSTVKLSGGTLNMGNNDIGTATELITLTAESGTLQNVASINGTGGLTKTTAGTLLLSGTIAYAGGTTVSEGTLTLGSAPDPLNANPANDASTVTIASTGATLNLTYTGTDKVDKLVIGGSQKNAGTYGHTNSGATNGGLGVGAMDAYFGPGAGTLTVASGSNFSSWIASTFAGGATVPLDKRGPNDDPDNDGIRNLVEYAIAGQDPTVGNSTIGTFTGSSLSFDKRQPLAIDITYAIQESIDLGLVDAWAEVTGGTYTNNSTTISYTFTPGTLPKDFFHLEVTQLP